MTKLSIIVPIYNVKPFLRRCLDSIKVPEKSLHEVQIILVDDGSTDGSEKIVDEYENRVGFEIIHKKNGGCCSARNAGIEIARGDYITHLDADDAYKDGAIGKMLELVDRYDANIIQMVFDKRQGETTKRVNCSDAQYRLNNLPAYWVLVWNKLYKREFIQSHGIKFKEGLNYDDDSHYNIQCFRFTEWIQGASEATIDHYYDNDGSITHTLNKGKFLNATDAMVELLREENPPQVETIIRERIVKKWTSKQYVEAFGGGR